MQALMHSITHGIHGVISCLHPTKLYGRCISKRKVFFGTGNIKKHWYSHSVVQFVHKWPCPKCMFYSQDYHKQPAHALSFLCQLDYQAVNDLQRIQHSHKNSPIRVFFFSAHLINVSICICIYLSIGDSAYSSTLIKM